MIRLSRAASAALVLLLAALLAGSSSAARTAEDVSIAMDDGVTIAATLHLPQGTPPAGGWPAIVFLHGLSGNRKQMDTVAAGYGFTGGSYAVLTFDARGHGQSGGLVGVDGPREVADTREVFEWLSSRSDVSDTKIGAWGISYGGGAIWNSLVAGVPWAAVEVVETWTDLHSALVPGGLVKSGLVAGLTGSIPSERRSPELDPVQAAAFGGTGDALVRSFAAARSSIDRLGSVRTPVFMMQGRRDFLFPIDQASRAFAKLKGPKRLYLGLHGHPPSAFPAADTAEMMRQGRLWFDRFLRGAANGIDKRPAVQLASAGKGSPGYTGAGLPKTSARTVALPGRGTIAAQGRIVRTGSALSSAVEVFGAPVVKATVTTSGGWNRLVAVLVARAPSGKELVVAAGGVKTAGTGTHRLAIRLVDQATLVPKGSRLRVYLGSSSNTQSPQNILYLQLPMPTGARLSVADATLQLPVLPT